MEEAGDATRNAEGAKEGVTKRLPKIPQFLVDTFWGIVGGKGKGGGEGSPTKEKRVALMSPHSAMSKPMV